MFISFAQPLLCKFCIISVIQVKSDVISIFLNFNFKLQII